MKLTKLVLAAVLVPALIKSFPVVLQLVAELLRELAVVAEIVGNN